MLEEGKEVTIVFTYSATWVVLAPHVRASDVLASSEPNILRSDAFVTPEERHQVGFALGFLLHDDR